MSPANVPYTPADRILSKLALGECTKGELLDVSGLKSYLELETVLAELEGKITLHWGEGCCRTYRLAEARPSNVPFSWMLPKPSE